MPRPRPVVIEARLNEYASRDPNPNVPWSAEEIGQAAAACAAAGASIVHFHARDPHSGAPAWDVEAYAEAMGAIRLHAPGVLVMPTLGAVTVPDAAIRVAHVTALAAHDATRPDLAPVDLVSTNIDPFDPASGTFATESLVYATSVHDIRATIATIRAATVAPMVALWTVGSARLLGALLATGDLERPVYAQLTLSDRILAAHPGTAAGLRAFLPFLPAGVVWSALNNGGNVLRLVPEIVEHGGHLAIGLGDWPHTEDPDRVPPTNAEVVAAAAALVESCGARVASPRETRAILGLADP